MERVIDGSLAILPLVILVGAALAIIALVSSYVWTNGFTGARREVRELGMSVGAVVILAALAWLVWQGVIWGLGHAIPLLLLAILIVLVVIARRLPARRHL